MDYRGVSINPGAHAELLMDGVPPLNPPHWSRYMNLDEAQSLLAGSGLTQPQREAVARTIIDRWWDGPVINTGSLYAEPMVSVEVVAKQLFRWLGG